MLTHTPQMTALKAKLFRGFSDTSRLSILEALRDGPLTVGALVEKTGLTQSNVSNHLRCLSAGPRLASVDVALSAEKAVLRLAPSGLPLDSLRRGVASAG